ncbi:MAG TPA: S9 family peptidase [Candidatus Elarobacter sp.]|jgi:dipeptidyl aminopeptidase/acylaminoacyl peptidase|nr:S9 family peptidase [Candidatus Elarobacter sp.]
MRPFTILALAAAFAASALPAAAADAKRPVKAEDLFKIAFASSATVSHDGKRVAFVVQRAELAKNAYRAGIWVAESDGSRVQQLTRGESDGEPAWSPDDRTIVFTRAHGGPPQLFAIDLAGGEAHALTHQEHGASGAVFSHDGKRIAFTSTAVDDAPAANVDWKALGIAPPAKYKKSDIRTLPWPRYQVNGAGLTYDKTPHIWTIDADGTNGKQLTSSRDGESGPLWSPDDKQILYGLTPLSSVEGDQGQMFVVPSTGGAPAKVAVAHYGAFPQQWTHDGKRILFAYTSRHDVSALPAIASVNPDGTAERTHIAENAALIGDAIINDTKENGSGCGELTPDDATLVTDVSIPGATEIDAFSMASGRATSLVAGGREIMDCSLSRDGKTIAYTALDATHLPEIYVFDRTANQSRQLTHLNDALTDALAIAVPEQHAVSNGQGGTVSYWVLKPPNAVAGKRYPTVLDIHGGPHTEFGNSFFHEFQVLAARGYIVVYANPRGSTGYGYEWSAALDGNWGDAMFADENAVMDDVVKRADVDPSRTFVSGGSYGGYATLWMIAHTNRFKAALAERVVSNLFTETLSADFAAPRGFEGPPGTPQSWGGALQSYSTLWQQSPLAHVASVRTPLLLLHGDADTRTPIAETLQEYEALKILGRPVELVQFPRETHDLSRTGEPIHRVERLHIIGDWFDRHLR